MRRTVVTLFSALLLSTGVLSGCLSNPQTESALEVSPTLPPPTKGGFSNTSVFPGTYDGSEPFSKVLTPGPYSLIDPEVTMLKSNVDGVPLQLAVVRPDVPSGTPTPVIAIAAPYFVPFTQRSIVEGPDPADPVGADIGYTHSIWLAYATQFVPHGYAVAMIALRGSGGSGGCIDLMGPLETADLDQAVTWLGTQPWSSGAVALAGLSYAGSTPWQVAEQGNPHLRTIVPMSGIPDLYGWMLKNGTRHVASPGLFVKSYHQLSVLWASPYNGKDAGTWSQAVACEPIAQAYEESLRSSATLERTPFWSARDHRAGVLDKYRGSILVVQGMEDWRVPPRNAYPFVSELESRGVAVKQILGQWSHSTPGNVVAAEHRRLDWAEILLHWFDYWLKGDTSKDLGPRVQVEDSTGESRSDDSWPPKDAWSLSLSMAPGGKLVAEPVEGSEDVIVGPTPRRQQDAIPAPLPAHVPEAAQPCPACPRFESEPFAKGLRFAGLPTLELVVTPTGPGGHVTALLWTTGAGGDRVVGRAQVDLRLAAGGEKTTTMVPGQALRAVLTFEPLDVHVPPDDRLVLEINQGSYGEYVPSTPSWPVRTHVGRGDGILTLKTFERDDSVFFRPPPLS